jgi:hypothetical protein
VEKNDCQNKRVLRGRFCGRCRRKLCPNARSGWIAGGAHSDTFPMVYLPKERLLIEGDAYTPLAPNAKPLATPTANNVNLIENIERHKLVVDRILPLHGRVVPLDDLHTTAGRTK